MAGWTVRKRRHIGSHLALAFGLIALGAGGLWSVFSGAWLPLAWLAAWLSSANVVGFAYYGIDKHQARSGGRRIPELVLHAIGAAGGAIGAYVAMRYFRHKTVKGPFRILYWLIVAGQILLLAWFIWA